MEKVAKKSTSQFHVLTKKIEYTDEDCVASNIKTLNQASP